MANTTHAAARAPRAQLDEGLRVIMGKCGCGDQDLGPKTSGAGLRSLKPQMDTNEYRRPSSRICVYLCLSV